MYSNNHQSETAGGIFIPIFKKGKVNKDEIYRSIKKYEERDCLALDGKHFPVKKMVIAQNAPLMHPRCRCSISAYMDRTEFDKVIGFPG